MFEKRNILYRKEVISYCEQVKSGKLVRGQVTKTYNDDGELISTLDAKEINPDVLLQMPQLQRRTTFLEKVKSLFQYLNITVKDGPNIQR